MPAEAGVGDVGIPPAGRDSFDYPDTPGHFMIFMKIERINKIVLGVNFVKDFNIPESPLLGINFDATFNK
jgi:hypothetical protein